MATKKPSGASKARKKSTSAKGKPAARKRAASTKARPKRTRKPPAKSASKKKRPSRKRPAGRASASTPVRVPFDFKRWAQWEALTWGAAATTGVAIAGGFLWMRAMGDVTEYLANPPSTVPGVVYSAPMEIRQHQTASLSSIAGDLLAAGYERVDALPDGAAGEGAGLFTVDAQGFEVWTAPMKGPGFDVVGGRASIRIADGRVSSVSPGTLRLRPTVLGTVGDLESRRGEVDLTTISEWMEPALLSMEDVRFRKHRGVDPVGVARALANNLIGRSQQGGSTLTQQLAKNLFLSSDRTIRRKVREAFFAAALETELDKDGLLELYLGEVYLGQMGGLPLHGVDAASRAWFGVSAQRLELHQAATLVGVIPAPNRYSPVRDPERAVERRNLVLDQMVKVGATDRATADAAKARPLELAGLEPSRIRRAPYAVDRAVDLAEKTLGQGALSSGGFVVHTHIQPLLQRAAEQAVAEGMAELDDKYPKARGAQAALVAVRASDGAIVAMVGGRSYATSAYNRATQAWRQAGSTVKPLTLLGALDEGHTTPAETLDDAPLSRVIDGKSWTPRNYDGNFVGPISVRRAIEGSRNIPAILLAEKVGPNDLRHLYRDAGLSRATNLPSAALGAFTATPLELAGAYTVLLDGSAERPWLVSALGTASGETLVQFERHSQPVASSRAAAITTDVLEGVLVRGTGARSSNYGVEGGAGKTGTTDDYRDAWFVGYTPELVVAVWVGQDRGTLGLSGSRAALPTWSRFVAASGTSGLSFRQPDGLVRAEVCDASGHLARPDCQHTHDELFEEGRVPSEKCDVHGAPTVRVGQILDDIFKRDSPRKRPRKRDRGRD